MPAKRPPPIGTLASFAESGQAFRIVCTGCGHTARPDYLKLVNLAGGWGSMMGDIVRRFRCRRCNRRAAKFTVLG